MRLDDPRLIAALEDLVRRTARSEITRAVPRIRIGIVFGDATADRTVAVKQLGQSEPAPGFVYGEVVPRDGDLVRVVISPTGDRYVDAVLTPRGTFSPLSESSLSLAGSHVVQTTDEHVNALAWDGQTLVFGTYPSGRIWTSMDRGQSWANPITLNNVDDIFGLVTPTPGVFIAGCSRNVAGGSSFYRSTDGGRSWLHLARPSSTNTEGYMLGAGGGVLIAGTGNTSAGDAKILRSVDLGETWTQVSATDSGKRTIRTICHVAGDIWIASAYGASPNEVKIYRSTDNGVNWTAVQTIASTDVYCALPLGDGRVLLGTHPNAVVYLSLDSGATFAQVSALPADVGQSQVVGFTLIGQYVLAWVQQAGVTAVFASLASDNGRNWTKVGQPPTPYWHYHNPIALDDRTIVGIASGAVGAAHASRADRFIWNG